jgi:hypothetical protein
MKSLGGITLRIKKMTVYKPFRRTFRQFRDGNYSEGGRWKYILHPNYAETPGQYIRAFLLLQEDLQKLFQYIEPSDINLDTYSFRIHELLLRTCVEAEANFKAILKENGYSEPGNWTLEDYKKIEASHFLSQYEIKYPLWRGEENIRKPFSPWSSSNSLQWYSDYNATKHDRHIEFHRASLTNLYNALTIYREEIKGRSHDPRLWAAKVEYIDLNEIETLDHIHTTLDNAVLDAYGWPHDLGDEKILERLLNLNLERAE